MTDQPDRAAAVATAVRTVGPATTPDGRLRLQTLVLIRWIALVGQAAAIVAVHFGLGFDMAFVPALLVVLVSVVLNGFLSLRYAPTTRLSDTNASLYLGFDTLQLAALLYLTGGIENPFAILMLVPVTVSATVLSLRSTLLLGTMAFVSVTIVSFFHLPLPWDEAAIALPRLYVVGNWTALVLGMGFIAIYAWRVAAEARRMSNALAETQMALAREQQFSSLGALAAAAAHELGTPLGTIALIAKEMRRDVEDGTPLGDDMDLLLRETERCRDILAQLSRDPRRDGDSPFESLAMPALIESIVAPRRTQSVAITIEQTTDPDVGMPSVPLSPEIVHGLGNIIENAVDFASTEVRIDVACSAQVLSVAIADDGPGFSNTVLGDLGEPYVSTRRSTGGMGLGLFIAKTLLERTGAVATFRNAASGGATVEIRWPRDILTAQSDEHA